MTDIPKKILKEYNDISKEHGVGVDKIQAVHAAAFDIESKANEVRPKDAQVGDKELHESAMRRTLVTIQSEIDTRSVPINGFFIAIDAARNMVAKRRTAQLELYEVNPGDSIANGEVCIIQRPNQGEDFPEGCTVVATTKTGLEVVSFPENDNLAEFIEGRGIDLPEGTYPLDTDEALKWDKDKPNKYYGTPLPIKNMVRRCQFILIDENGNPSKKDLVMRGSAAESDMPDMGEYVRFAAIPSKNNKSVYGTPKKWSYSPMVSAKGSEEPMSPFDVLEQMVSSEDSSIVKNITDILALEDFNATAAAEKDPWRVAIFVADIQDIIPPQRGNSYIIPLTDATRLSDMKAVYGSGSVTGFLPDETIDKCNFNPTDRVWIIGTTRKQDDREVSVSIQGIISSSGIAKVDLSSILSDNDTEREMEEIESLYSNMV